MSVDLPEALPRLLTTAQTSELTGIPERTLWRHSRSGVMPAPRKIGSLCRYDRLEIEQWLANGCPRVDGSAGG
jgi:excisionase family DNA binding protein